MEERSLPDPLDLDTGIWIVAIPPTPRACIGKVVQLNAQGPELDNNKPKEFTRLQILKAEWITLYPAFDFLTTTRSIPVFDKDRKPVINRETGAPEMAMERAPYVNPLDFTLEPVPLDVRCAGLVAIYHFSQMSRIDRAQYKSFVAAAADAQKRYRQAASGIAAPTNEERQALQRHAR